MLKITSVALCKSIVKAISAWHGEYGTNRTRCVVVLIADFNFRQQVHLPIKDIADFRINNMANTNAQNQHNRRLRLSHGGLFKRRDFWVHVDDEKQLRILESKLRKKRLKEWGK